MNALAIKVALRTFGNKLLFAAKRNAPQIMVGLGVAGFVGTAVATGTSAVKAKDLMAATDQVL